MPVGDAGKRDEKPERALKVGGGTTEGKGLERQTGAARGENTGNEAASLIEQVVRRENMQRAYERVVRNGGAPGADGITVEALGRHCREHWTRIRAELLDGSYQPQPVRKVEIPKPDGKGKRLLGIPCVIDRLIQQALLQVLQPLLDPNFSNASYGFRPGRSTHGAIAHARSHIEAGYRYVVDLDLEKFFDRVNHDVLMSRVAKKVGDKRVLRVIRRYLQAGVMEGGLVTPRTEGTPQGGPLSPLLSNVLLDDLDKELERRGHRHVRYADDCNVYVKSKSAGERVMASLKRYLSDRLKLKVNEEKSAVARPWERKFLGYTVLPRGQGKMKLKPAAESVKRLKKKLRPLLRRGRGQKLSEVIAVLNRITRGWVAYFRLSEVKQSFEGLDQWIRRKLRCILWRQWKRPRTRLKELLKRGLEPEHARASASNGRGPWWNAGAMHMNQAVPTRVLGEMGLVSLLDEHARVARSS